ncbi:MAG TPA: hypothetical protein VE712_02655 [Actinomycetota bacterium]|nr:hypothetical protein [Actinomycetota bacterium]
MSTVVTLLVGVGLAMTLALAAGRGLDPLGALLLGLIAVLGALGIAVARRAARGGTQPTRCSRCEGLVSAHSPYCKHCGASASGRS